MTAFYNRLGVGDLGLQQVARYSRRAFEPLQHISGPEEAKQPLYALARRLIKRDH